MKFSFEEAARLAAAGLFSSLLVACGSDNKSSSNGDGDDHDHEHGALLVSQQNSTAVSMFDEENADFDAFEGNSTITAAKFVRSDNGEFAALNGGTVVEFVGEDGFLQTTVTGDNVVATNGHFSILNNGMSSFVEVEALEDDPETLALEAISDLGITEAEVYPALMLDEDESLVMVFVSDAAKIYGGEPVAQIGADIECTDPVSTAQGHHAVIVTCSVEGVKLVQFEDEPSLSFTVSGEDVTGTNDSDYLWTSTEHVFAGYAPGTSNYDIIHVEENGDIDNVDVSADGALALTANICEASIEGEDEDFLFWLEGGTFAAANNEAVPISATGLVAVDDSSSTDCSDYSFSVTEKVAFVFDNNAQKFHEIDIEEDATFYHVHETIDTGVSDIADSVAFIEHEESGQDHGDDHDDHGDDHDDHEDDHGDEEGNDEE